MRASSRNIFASTVMALSSLTAVTLVTPAARAETVDPYSLQRWAARYNGPASSSDAARAIGVSPDGTRVFATGESTGTGSGTDYATVAVDAETGSQLWATRYNGPASSTDYAYALAVSPDGSKVFVTGQSSADYATVAYDAASGAQLWVARYNGPSSSGDIARAIGVSPDGSRVFVTGESLGPGQDYATVAYGAASGAQLWVARYNGVANIFDLAFALAVSPDGASVFVTGESFNAVDPDYATVAYDAVAGTQRWVARYDGPGNDDIAHGIAVSRDGSRVYVTGRSRDSGTDLEYATVAYNAATGAQVWVARYNGPGAGDIASAVGVSPDGSKVFVTGYSLGSGSGWDYATVAYNAASGAQVWATRYNGPVGGEDIAWAMAISPDGSEVYATGGSSASGIGHDFATVAYDAGSGGQRWVARYNGPASSTDFAYAAAVSPDGSRVYVAGQSFGSGTGADYAIVATAQRARLDVNPALADVPQPQSAKMYLTLSATLKDRSTEAGISGASVSFFVGDELQCTGTTAADGTVSCGSVAELLAVAGAGTYTAIYSGDAKYLSAAGSGPLARALGLDIY